MLSEGAGALPHALMSVPHRAKKEVLHNGSTLVLLYNFALLIYPNNLDRLFLLMPA
jgi:hypothetical protein